MLMNRSWMAAAVLGLAAISLFEGCGSDRKADAPPAITTPGPEKIAAAPDVTSPSPKATDETRPESPVLKSSKPEKDLGPKLTKRPSPPKAMARPAQTAKIVSPLSGKDVQESNPMRPAAEPLPEMNPVRPGIPLAEERSSVSAARSSESSQILKGRKTYMEVSEDAAGATPGMAEPPPPAPAAAPGAAEPSTTAADAAPADANEFISMARDQKGYTVVKVYYGTDRAALTNVQPKPPVYLPWLIRTIVAAATALFLSLLGFRFFPSRLFRVLAYCGMFATGVLAGLTIYARFQAPLPDDMARTPPAASVSYGPERGKLELGACEVSIPKSHEVGELESPSVLRLEFREDPSRHVVLLGIQPEPADRFFADLRECVGRSKQKSAFVFVHGYNVGFEDAARRTAQIAYDLKFDGAPSLF